MKHKSHTIKGQGAPL